MGTKNNYIACFHIVKQAEEIVNELDIVPLHKILKQTEVQTMTKPKNSNINYESNSRIKRSIILASVQRGSAVMVPHQCKKIKFN